MPIAKGTQVRQVVPAIEGEVSARRFNEEADCMEYLVSFTNADGSAAERWFLEAQLEPKE